ncbi:MAG: futalosine hydrolase [Desulfobulbaceae bacterium]|nr:futalosine hydrolase [Desulfobulbaceae bacterium]
MYLITAATEMEMAPVRQRLAGCSGVDFLVTGVGMLEATLGLCRRFRQSGEALHGVVNLGIAGAYVDTGVKMLDLCLAKREIIGDLGVSSGEQVFPFSDAAIRPPMEFSLQNPLLVRASAILEENEISYYTGVFVSVNAVSGSRSRGIFFRDQYSAICENMEGAAIARTCAAYGVDCLELRSVSNMVVDRDPSRWRLAEAIDACALVAGQLIPELVARS